jgi:hypothetical protein
MPVLKLNNQHTKFLNVNYPNLTYNHIKNVIVGFITFDLKYRDKEQIKDSYKIEIDLNQVSDLGMPIIREINGRILKIAEKKNTFFGNLHLNNKDGEMCMILPPKVKERYPNGFDLETLLEHIEEHLYWVSYFEKYDKKPWKEYGHGDLGYYELYLEDKVKYSVMFKEYFKCKSRPEFRRAIKNLRKKYKK